MKKSAALTICAINYIPKALVLIDSYLLHHPDHTLYLVVVDRKVGAEQINDVLKTRRLKVIWVEDLGLNNFPNYAFMYDIIELNTNVKPYAIRKILNEHDVVVYLDPDIKVYAPLTPVFEALETAAIVVTPHSNTPVMDGCKPDDMDLLKFGVYNLGFIGLSSCEESNLFLDWWSDRCLQTGFYEPQLGLGVDQKWVGLASGFFPSFRVINDVGLNVAFWNLHERRLSQHQGKWLVNYEKELRFFHFSSFNPNMPDQIAHKQNRFPKGARLDFNELAIAYATELLSNSNQQIEQVPYGFDYFEGGVYITPALRRFYAALRLSIFAEEKNPFSSNSSVMKFAKRHSLINKNNKPSRRHTFQDANNYSFQIKVINKMLRLLLFVLGPERYFNLMRYLAHISSLLNQAGLFSDKP